MKKMMGLVMIVLVLGFSLSAEAVTVRTEAVSSGVYEDGKYTSTNETFTAEYDINENAGIVKRTKVFESTREGRADAKADYDISNMMASEGLSAFMVSREKMGQKIVTSVRDMDPNSVEILMIGRDFYQYCNSLNGKFYLEYGNVIREEEGR